MAFTSVTNTLSNGSTIDAGELNTNFTDLVNGLSDGSKDISVNALTTAGAATLGSTLDVTGATTFSSTVTIGSDSADSFPSGTAMIFYQAAAPTGWTLSVTADDHYLRVETSGGGNTGGTIGASSGHSHGAGSLKFKTAYYDADGAGASLDQLEFYNSSGTNVVALQMQQTLAGSGGGFTFWGNPTSPSSDTQFYTDANSGTGTTDDSDVYQYADVIICTKD